MKGEKLWLNSISGQFRSVRCDMGCEPDAKPMPQEPSLLTILEPCGKLSHNARIIVDSGSLPNPPRHPPDFRDSGYG